MRFPAFRSPPTALVIERDNELRAALGEAMHELGFDVLTVPEAADAAALRTPDIVVGETPAAPAAAMPWRVPVVAYGFDAARPTDAVSDRCDAILAQPFGLAELETAVRAALAAPGSRQRRFRVSRGPRPFFRPE